MYRDIKTLSELQRALSEYKSENYSEAIAICEELAHIGAPTLPEEDDVRVQKAALLLMARCCIARNNMEAALEMYSEAMLIAEDKLDERRICEEAMEAGADMGFCAAQFHRTALELYKQGSLAEAADAYNKAGICHYRAGGDLELEERMYTKALKILQYMEEGSPLEPDILVLKAMVSGNLAECYQRQEQPNEALELYEQATEILSGRLDDETCLLHSAMYRCSAADIFSGCGDNVKAAELLSGTIVMLESRYIHSDEVRSQIVSCCNAYSAVCFQMGAYEGEVAACNKALRLGDGQEDEETETILCNRAQAYEAMGKFTAAAADYCRCIEILERHDTEENRLVAALRRFSLGYIRDNEGRLSEAAEQYERAAEVISAARKDQLTCVEADAEMLTDMEALCRFRLGSVFTRTETRNYYRACKEYETCIDLLYSLGEAPARAAQFSSAHTALAELYEMFDEYEKAKVHFAKAEENNAVAALGELIMSVAMSAEDDAVCDDGEGYFAEDDGDEESETPEA